MTTDAEVDDLVTRLRVPHWQISDNDDDRITRVIEERDEALVRITADSAVIAAKDAEIRALEHTVKCRDMELTVVGEIGQRFADVFLTAKTSLTELQAAIADLLQHRVGELPNRGWLRDNDITRAALARLAALNGGADG